MTWSRGRHIFQYEASQSFESDSLLLSRTVRCGDRIGGSIFNKRKTEKTASQSASQPECQPVCKGSGIDVGVNAEVSTGVPLQRAPFGKLIFETRPTAHRSQRALLPSSPPVSRSGRQLVSAAVFRQVVLAVRTQIVSLRLSCSP